MNEYRFKIEKNRVYKAYEASDVMSFETWLKTVYLTRDVRYMFLVSEDDTYIKMKLQTYKEWGKETVREFIVTVLRDFKSYFIQAIIGDFRVAYLDPEHTHHAFMVEEIDALRYDIYGNERSSLYDIFAKMEEDFMTLHTDNTYFITLEPVEQVIKDDVTAEEPYADLQIELEIIDDTIDFEMTDDEIEM